MWRYQHWFFRSGLFFHPAIELCITSYPSPLEENAPLVVKAVLHATAGILEFVAASWVSGAVAGISNMISIEIFGIRSDFEDQLLIFMVVLSLILRVEAFSTTLSRQKYSLVNVVTAFFWHNPLASIYVICLLWSKQFGSKRVGISLPRFFWALLAPSFEAAEMHMEMFSMLQSNMRGALLTTLSIPIIRGCIRHGPSVMIKWTLFWQNLVHEQSSSPEAGGVVVDHTNYQQPPSHVDLIAPSKNPNVSNVHHQMNGASVQQERGADEVKDRRGQIRLLQLYAGSGSAPIQCSRRWYDIKNLPTYTAISYCWGEDKRVRTIQLNGNSIQVTESAFEVLTNVRSAWKTKLLWIDAICIDQDCKEEKSRQLPLMPRIYRDAEEVIVWLGYSKSAELAISLIHRLFMIGRIRAVAGDKFIYEVPKEAAQALTKMLDRPWFQRVWVVQEVVQPDRNVKIRYGCAAISWERFSWFTQSIVRDEGLSEMVFKRTGLSKVDITTILRNVSIMRRFACVKSTPLSLPFYLTQMFRSRGRFQSSDPKDRIYALLGLSGSNNIRLKPNYSNTLSQLFIDFVKKSDEKCKARDRLAFLVHAGMGYGQSEEAVEVPTWIPDWTVSFSGQPLLGTEGASELLNSPSARQVLDDAASLASFAQYDPDPRQKHHHQHARQQAEKVRSETVAKLYNATPNTEARIEFLPNNILQLQGYQHDRIRAVGNVMPVFTDTSTAEKEGETILTQWFGLTRKYCPKAPSSSTPAPGGKPPPDPLISMLHDFIPSAQLDYTFVSAPKNIAQLAIDEDLRFTEKDFQPLVWKGKVHMLPPPPPPGWSEEDERRKKKELVERKSKFASHLMYESCGGRCFAVTEKGNMGLFLPGTKPGDCVMLFEGGTVPFCLRAANAESKMEGRGGGGGGGGGGGDNDDALYRLIGPAYVHGIMYGEAMTEDVTFKPVRIC